MKSLNNDCDKDLVDKQLKQTHLATMLDYYSGKGASHITIFIAFVFGLFTILAILFLSNITDIPFVILSIIYFFFSIGGLYEFFKFSFYNNVVNHINVELDNLVPTPEYTSFEFGSRPYSERKGSKLSKRIYRIFYFSRQRSLVLNLVVILFSGSILFAWIASIFNHFIQFEITLKQALYPFIVILVFIGVLLYYLTSREELKIVKTDINDYEINIELNVLEDTVISQVRVNGKPILKDKMIDDINVEISPIPIFNKKGEAIIPLKKGKQDLKLIFPKERKTEFETKVYYIAILTEGEPPLRYYTSAPEK